MSDTEFRTAPDPTLTSMPPGVPFIIGNELAERFSFYGMRAILTVFMTEHLLNAAGKPDYLSEENAKGIYHLFVAAAYFFPIIGSIISDVVWGKYKTILLISLMYCAGHGCLALMDLGPHTGLWGMKPLLYAGILLIAVGAGGIKPCVSAHVGDQFGRGNHRLLTQIFNWFYFAINLGAAASTFLTPILLVRLGPWAAFGLPGALMALATFVFWLGRNKFIHVPPVGWGKFQRETFSDEGRRALKNLSPLFLIFVPVFWAIFDQTGSAWVLQAESMDRDFGGITWLKSQVQVVNPVLILTLIPIFTYVVYPAMKLFFEPTPLRKIGIGFALTVFAFGISAMIETTISENGDAPADELWTALTDSTDGPGEIEVAVQIAKTCGWDKTRIQPFLDMGGSKGAAALWHTILKSGDRPRTLSDVVRAARSLNWDQERIGPYLADMPNIGWQFLAYLVLTSAEILVSIVCLEFAYTQSPLRMKSFIMGVYFLGVSLGNLAVAALNFVLEALKDEKTGVTPLDGANYYWFFAGLMLVTTLGYLIFAQFYRGETFIQGDVDEAVRAEAEAEGGDVR